MAYKHSGFTLIELLITVAIIALLASMAEPVTQLVVQRSKEQTLRTNLRKIRAAIDAYKQAADDGLIVKPIGASGYPPSLRALVQGVPDIKDPRRHLIYFLRRMPRDPLFPETSVPAEATWGLRSYASPPDDPQEGDDVYDVYSLSPGTGLNGVPYRQW